jgi:hypothetical protein
MVAIVALISAAGCGGASQAKSSATGGSSTSAADRGLHMSGPAVDVHIPAAVLAAQPKKWDLSTPESAVRSYLDWTTYSYRVANSDASSLTATAQEGVRVDSYVQYNIQKKQLIDQTLTRITFGKPTTEATHTLVATTEDWKYSYLSIAQGNPVLRGPFTVSYDVVYTLLKTPGNAWVVDSVKATPKGQVK